MNLKPKKIDIKEAVMKKIKEEKIKIRPKSHFIAKAVLVALGTVIVFTSLIYLISFIFFILRRNGIWFLPEFGFRGINIFLVSFPWLLVLIGIVFFIILEISVRKFSFTYRHPLVYSILAMVVFVLIAGFIVSKTPIHKDFFQRAKEGRLPIAGPFYRNFSTMRSPDFHLGTVSNVIDDGFQIETRDGQILTVNITSSARFRGQNEIEENDVVIVIGEKEDSTVTAVGVREIRGDINDFPSRSSPRTRPSR